MISFRTYVLYLRTEEMMRWERCNFETETETETAKSMVLERKMKCGTRNVECGAYDFGSIICNSRYSVGR